MKIPLINKRAFVLATFVAVAAVFWFGANTRAGAQAKRLPRPSGHVNEFAEVLDAARRDRVHRALLRPGRRGRSRLDLDGLLRLVAEALEELPHLLLLALEMLLVPLQPLVQLFAAREAVAAPPVSV